MATTEDQVPMMAGKQDRPQGKGQIENMMENGETSWVGIINARQQIPVSALWQEQQCRGAYLP
jgi:hypothetical protein